jgi:hypothetical protein
MTQTTVPPKSAAGGSVRLTETFSKYRFDADAVSARTDTPDLMRAFRDDAELAEGYMAMREVVAAAHADLAAASLKTLPDW